VRHFAHVFPTFGPGGQQARTAAVLNGLPPGCRHTIVALDGLTTSRERFRAGLPVEFARPASGIVPLGRLLRRIAPDLLFTYNWGSMDAVIGAALGRVRPWIHVEDGFGPDEAVRQKRRRVWTRGLLLRGAHSVIVPSRSLESIARKRWRLPARAVRLIPNGVDAARFTPGDGGEVRRLLKIPAGAVVVGTVGYLRREKNPVALVDAFAEAAPRDAHLLFVGSGPLEESTRDRVRALGIGARVHLAGHQADPAPWHRAIDLFALASSTEQLPVALLESMATGVAAVCTDVGDVRWALSEDNRIAVVAGGDAKAFRDALGSLTRDAALRGALGRSNRRRVLERFRSDTMLEAYREAIDSALASRFELLGGIGIRRRDRGGALGRGRRFRD
jgi:glycosyltransferase involved in cell wall biosynthesis